MDFYIKNKVGLHIKPKRAEKGKNSIPYSVHYILIIYSISVQRPLDPRRWSTEEVQDWLHENGLSEYCSIFEKNHIDGQQLHICTEQSTLMRLGVAKIGDRKRMHKRALELLPWIKVYKYDPSK